MMTEKGVEHLTDDQRPSQRVVKAVAEAAGHDDPIELDTCLYDVVDPDALDSIFRARGDVTRTTGFVAFSLDGFEVSVYSDGRVDVTESRT